MHDNSMARTTGWALPLELTPSFWARTRRLQSGHEAVPSLKQALDALPEDRLVAVDVKTPWAILPLAAAVRKRRIAGRTLVWCSSALVVQYAVRRNLGWEVAHYKDFEDSLNNRAFIETARLIGAQAVSLDWRAIDTELVAFAHERGLSVYSWHKDYELAATKLTAGLDGIITDYPARTREAVTAALGTR
jgi:glycerophosphoryl diester phosphodiesterase